MEFSKVQENLDQELLVQKELVQSNSIVGLVVDKIPLPLNGKEVEKYEENSIIMECCKVEKNDGDQELLTEGAEVQANNSIDLGVHEIPAQPPLDEGIFNELLIGGINNYEANNSIIMREHYSDQEFLQVKEEGDLSIDLGIDEAPPLDLYRKELVKEEMIDSEENFKMAESFNVEVNSNDFQAQGCQKNPLICSEFGKNFSHRRGFKKHVLIHDKKRRKKTFKCEECGKILRSLENLNSHLSSHRGEKNYDCQICGKKFAHRSSCKRHLATLHKNRNLVPRKRNHSFDCEICDKNFATADNLKSHEATHDASEKTLSCFDCGLEFKHKYGMAAHIRYVHNVEARKYSCHRCEKKFLRPSELKIHLLSHDGLKLFPCTVCPKKYAHAQSLKNHLRIHSESMPPQFQCDQCGSKFGKRSDLKRHLGTHFKELKRFSCDECPSKFYYRSDLEKHILRFHRHATA